MQEVLADLKSVLLYKISRPKQQIALKLTLEVSGESLHQKHTFCKKGQHNSLKICVTNPTYVETAAHNDDDDGDDDEANDKIGGKLKARVHYPTTRPPFVTSFHATSA